MSTTYATYRDAIDARYHLELATGTAGLRLTIHGEDRLLKFWLSDIDAQDLADWLIQLAANQT